MCGERVSTFPTIVGDLDPEIMVVVSKAPDSNGVDPTESGAFHLDFSVDGFAT